MANNANSSLSTNFNVSPYYDDYNEDQNYYRILYRPGYAVQARELTQMQTILQKQIDRFGRHVFREGSIVIPGNFDLFAANTASSTKGPLNYVKVKDVDDSNNDVVISNFNDVEVTGQTSGVKAFVNIVVDGSDTTSNTKTLYIDYLSSSNSNTSVVTFQAGETLTSSVGNLKVVNSNALGTASAFRISSGVVFSKGFFLYFPTQEVVLDRYNDTPTCKVGFKINEYIVDATTDINLLDPALEASNYSAPGANRLKLGAELQVRSIDDPEDLPDFVTLFTIKEGVIQTYNERSEYSIVKDEWARRTFDESGDYYVRGLDIEMREHKATATNGGLFGNGNSSFISVKVEPGLAYVKGYEVGTLIPKYLIAKKSTEFSNVENQIASAFLGSYVTINDMVGHLPTDTGTTVNLYDVYQDRLANLTFSSTGVTPSGNNIGTAKLVSIEYNSGTLGTQSGKSDLYLMDIRMTGSNSFTTVKSVFIDNTTTPDFLADVVPDPVTGTTILYEPYTTPLLYYTGSNYTRKIKDTTGASDTSFDYTPTLVTSFSAGTGTVSAPGSDSLPYTGSLSTTSKREVFVSLESALNVSTGITATNVSGNTIVGTNFNKLNVGDKLEFSGLSNTYVIISIANSTHLVIDQVPFKPLTGNTVFKAYKTGDYVDLTTTGFTSGTARSVSASGSTLTIDLGESITSDARVTFRARKSVAVQSAKTLRASRYVTINCDSGGTSGPYNLGFSDVYRIKQIRKDTSAFTTNTQGSLVTTSFTFDNGQRDTHYELASIKPVAALSASDRLLVELDYFYPDYTSGKGYFSVDSYPIDDSSSSSTTISTAEIPIYKSPSSGLTYDLRNHLDFRPVKSITASDSTTVAGATENPAVSTTFNYSGTGIALVAPSSTITYDYSYYLARKDVLHVNPDKVFSITRGVPASIPVTPQIGDNEMALAILTIAPYPSISPYYAKLIGRQDIASSARKVAPIRQTMRDIGVMKERIQNLEYYASLSLLEKNAVDLLITDENGNDRFKNGIFIDTFNNHLLGATYNQDYRIVVDPTEKSIRPLYSMQSIDYDYLSGTNVKKSNNDIITLDYTEVEFANVSGATNIYSSEKSSYRFVGNLTLRPPEDIWIDTITLPPNTITINDANIDGLEDAQQVGGVTTSWNAWQTSVTGYKVYTGTGALVGTYSTKTEAEKAAQSILTTTTGAKIETIYTSTRTGTEYFNYSDADTASIGSKVVSTEIIPYIRPQVLMGAVTGLKPYARFYIFFDGIAMSDYVRPITKTEYENTNTVKTWTNTQGAALVSNADGELWFRLSLPNSDNLRFTTGQKQVVVSDSITNAGEIATSYATQTFFAQGVTQTKQDTILSTRQTEIKSKTLSESTTSSTYTTLPPLVLPPPPDDEKDGTKYTDSYGGSTGYYVPDGYDPATSGSGLSTNDAGMDAAEAAAAADGTSSAASSGGAGGGPGESGECTAYALPIRVPNNQEGIFLSSVEVFCAEKHPTLGVWFEIREVDAGGGITRNSVPLSKKWYKNSQVPISTNGRTNGLRVTFDSPLFLYANKSYAFVIHPEAGNPNYYFWISRIGETDVNTGKQITNRLGTGTTYTTNNDILWVIEDLVDLTCKWYRASFVPTGSFEIGNKPKEKIYIKDLVGSIEGFGDPIVSSDKITLSDYSGSTIALNDFIVGANSSINARVISISSGTYAMSNIRYQSGESVTVRYAGNAAVKGTATLSTLNNGRGMLEYYKESANATYMILANSDGNFAATDRVFDISDEGYATIDKITNFRYSVVDFEPSFINFSGAKQTFEMATYSNTGSSQSYIPIESSENYEFNTEMAIFSRSNEIALSNRSNKVRVKMATISNYISPVFDLAKTQTVIVDNLINNSANNETNATGGELFNKYISKIVTLAEGQDAEDSKVFLTAYRPPNTDVRVWIKIINGDDSDTIALKSWIELEKSYGGDILYSSLANKKDFKEFTFNIPSSYLTGSQGQVQYTNSQGITFTGFKSFQIKIGLLGTNSAVVPRVADVRAIALQI